MIVKEWSDVNQDEIDYFEHDKVIVKSCVHFYHECWKTRCVELHKEENQLKLLREQVKKFKESDVNERVEGMHDYISKYEIK